MVDKLSLLSLYLDEIEEEKRISFIITDVAVAVGIVVVVMIDVVVVVIVEEGDDVNDSDTLYLKNLMIYHR